MTSPLVEGMVNAACQLLQLQPCLLTGNPSNCRLDASSIPRQMLHRAMCDPTPYPPPPAVPLAPPGQCANQLYKVNIVTEYDAQFGGHQTETGTLRYQKAPIGVAGTRTVNGFIAGYVSTAEYPELQATPAVNVRFNSNFKWRIVSIEREDGTTEGCGTPAPIGYPPEYINPDADPVPPTEIQINTNIEISPNVIVPIAFGLMINNVHPEFNFVLNNDIAFNFNLGGLDFSPSGGSPPALPPEVITNINNTNDTVNNINNTVTNINNTLENTPNCCDDIAEIKQKIGNPVSIAIAPKEKCGDWNLSTPNTIFGAIALSTQSEKIIDSRDCNEEGQPTEQVLLQGTSSIEQSSFYVPLPTRCVGIKVALTGDLPPKQTYRVSNEASGKFGAIAFTRDGASGEQYFLWTRLSSFPVENDFYSGARLFLNPGIEFTLYSLLKPEVVN